jgi:hypothetical protein
MLPILNRYILRILLPPLLEIKFWAANRFFSRLITSFLALLLLAPSLSFAQQQKAFKTGERLKYSVHYGIIRGGEAVLEVRDGSYNNKKVNHLYLQGRTVGLANKLYNVNDIYQSFTNLKTDLPYMSIRDINENRYTKYTVQTFDHLTRSDSTIVNSSDTGEVLAPPNSNDILSAFYYLRNHLLWKSIEIGDTLVVDTYFSDEIYSMKVRFIGYETIKTKLGKINCLKFLPVVITGRVFKNEDDMTVWFTNDKNFLPIRVKFDIFVGSVYCDLIEYKNLLHPFDSLRR